MAILRFFPWRRQAFLQNQRWWAVFCSAGGLGAVNWLTFLGNQSEKTATASQWRGKKLPAGCIFYENFLSTLLSLSKSKIAGLTVFFTKKTEK
jgi:hypothetical protein